MSKTRDKGQIIKTLILFLGIPLCLVLGVTLLKDRSYALVSMAVGLLACLPFFFTFEQKKANTRKMILIAVMVALTTVGRIAFGFLPGIQPVIAMVIITAMYFGPEAGFLTGALSVVVSNIFFGQGPWTPFQMFTWGTLGFFAGLCSGLLKRSRLLMCLFGFLGGIVYSLFMDVWTTFSMDGAFNWSRYLGFLVTAMPWMARYAVSNILFLLLLSKPIGAKLERIKTKYGI